MIQAISPRVTPLQTKKKHLKDLVLTHTGGHMQKITSRIKSTREFIQKKAPALCMTAAMLSCALPLPQAHAYQGNGVALPNHALLETSRTILPDLQEADGVVEKIQALIAQDRQARREESERKLASLKLQTQEITPNYHESGVIVAKSMIGSASFSSGHSETRIDTLSRVNIGGGYRNLINCQLSLVGVTTEEGQSDTYHFTSPTLKEAVTRSISQGENRIELQRDTFFKVMKTYLQLNGFSKSQAEQIVTNRLKQSRVFGTSVNLSRLSPGQVAEIISAVSKEGTGITAHLLSQTIKNNRAETERGQSTPQPTQHVEKHARFQPIINTVLGVCSASVIGYAVSRLRRRRQLKSPVRYHMPGAIHYISPDISTGNLRGKRQHLNPFAVRAKPPQTVVSPQTFDRIEVSMDTVAFECVRALIPKNASVSHNYSTYQPLITSLTKFLIYMQRKNPALYNTDFIQNRVKGALSDSYESKAKLRTLLVIIELALGRKTCNDPEAKNFVTQFGIYLDTVGRKK